MPTLNIIIPGGGNFQSSSPATGTGSAAQQQHESGIPRSPRQALYEAHRFASATLTPRGGPAGDPSYPAVSSSVQPFSNNAADGLPQPLPNATLPCTVSTTPTGSSYRHRVSGSGSVGTQHRHFIIDGGATAFSTGRGSGVVVGSSSRDGSQAGSRAPSTGVRTPRSDMSTHHHGPTDYQVGRGMGGLMIGYNHPQNPITLTASEGNNSSSSRSYTSGHNSNLLMGGGSVSSGGFGGSSHRGGGSAGGVGGGILRTVVPSGNPSVHQHGHTGGPNGASAGNSNVHHPVVVSPASHYLSAHHNRPQPKAINNPSEDELASFGGVVAPARTSPGRTVAKGPLGSSTAVSGVGVSPRSGVIPIVPSAMFPTASLAAQEEDACGGAQRPSSSTTAGNGTFVAVGGGGGIGSGSNSFVPPPQTLSRQSSTLRTPRRFFRVRSDRKNYTAIGGGYCDDSGAGEELSTFHRTNTATNINSHKRSPAALGLTPSADAPLHSMLVSTSHHHQNHSVGGGSSVGPDGWADTTKPSAATVAGRSGAGDDGSRNNSQCSRPPHSGDDRRRASQRLLPENTQVGKGDGSAEYTTASSGVGRLGRPRCRVPLSALFIVQTILIAAGFTTLITLAVVRTTELTLDMVRSQVESEMTSVRVSVLDPLMAHEAGLLALRNRYLTYKSQQNGVELCSETSLSFDDSAQFFTDAATFKFSKPDISYVFHLRQSTVYTRADGTPEVVSCAAIPSGLLSAAQGLNRFSYPLSAARLEEPDGLSTLQYVSRDDRTAFLYGMVRMGTAHLSWNTFPSFDETTGKGYVFLVGFAPNRVNRMGGADGKTIIETFRPDLSGLQIADPTLVATSLTGICINFTSYTNILGSVTPDVEGAHTSLYNLDKLELLATSDANCPIFDDANGRLYSAGGTASERLNKAYRAVSAHFYAAETVPTLSNNFATVRYSAPIDTLVLDNVGGDVVSCASIASDSGINFAVVQSTPRASFLKDATFMMTNFVVLGVLLCIALMAVWGFVTLSMRASLTIIGEGMGFAAAMKNERVVPYASYLLEVDTLCAALDMMNDRLMQARAFMPQAMLLDSNQDDEDEEDLDDEGDADLYGADDRDSRGYYHRHRGGAHDEYPPNKMLAGGTPNSRRGGILEVGGNANNGNNGSSLLHRHLEKRFGARSPQNAYLSVDALKGNSDSDTVFKRHGTGVTTNTSGTTKTNSSGGGGAAAAGPTSALTLPSSGTSPSLATKRVTILAINTRGFHMKVNRSASTIVSLTNALTTMITTLGTRERGVVDSFHGDHYVLTFNVARANAQGPSRAARCALDLIDGFAPYDDQMQLSMGISTGRALVGQLGTTGLKRLSIIGRVYSRAMALERICKRFNEQASCLPEVADMEKSGRGGGRSTDHSTTAFAYSTTTRAPENSRPGKKPLQHPSATNNLQQPFGKKNNPYAIECVTDSMLAAEIQHVYMLQALGAIGEVARAGVGGGGVGSGGGGVTSEAFGKSTAKRPSVIRLVGDARDYRTGTNNGGDGKGGGYLPRVASGVFGHSPVRSRPLQPLMRQGNSSRRGGRGGGVVGSSSPLPPQTNPLLPNAEKELEVIYALRASRKQEEREHNEWLYELTQEQKGVAGRAEACLSAVNDAMLAYLQQLRRINNDNECVGLLSILGMMGADGYGAGVQHQPHAYGHRGSTNTYGNSTSNSNYQQQDYFAGWGFCSVDSSGQPSRGPSGGSNQQQYCHNNQKQQAPGAAAMPNPFGNRIRRVSVTHHPNAALGGGGWMGQMVASTAVTARNSIAFPSQVGLGDGGDGEGASEAASPISGDKAPILPNGMPPHLTEFAINVNHFGSTAGGSGDEPAGAGGLGSLGVANTTMPTTTIALSTELTGTFGGLVSPTGDPAALPGIDGLCTFSVGSSGKVGGGGYHSATPPTDDAAIIVSNGAPPLSPRAHATAGRGPPQMGHANAYRGNTAAGAGGGVEGGVEGPLGTAGGGDGGPLTSNVSADPSMYNGGHHQPMSIHGFGASVPHLGISGGSSEGLLGSHGSNSNPTHGALVTLTSPVVGGGAQSRSAQAVAILLGDTSQGALVGPSPSLLLSRPLSAIPPSALVSTADSRPPSSYQIVAATSAGGGMGAGTIGGTHRQDQQPLEGDGPAPAVVVDCGETPAANQLLQLPTQLKATFHSIGEGGELIASRHYRQQSGRGFHHPAGGPATLNGAHNEDDGNVSGVCEDVAESQEALAPFQYHSYFGGRGGEGGAAGVEYAANNTDDRPYPQHYPQHNTATRTPLPPHPLMLAKAALREQVEDIIDEYSELLDSCCMLESTSVTTTTTTTNPTAGTTLTNAPPSDEAATTAAPTMGVLSAREGPLETTGSSFPPASKVVPQVVVVDMMAAGGPPRHSTVSDTATATTEMASQNHLVVMPFDSRRNSSLISGGGGGGAFGGAKTPMNNAAATPTVGLRRGTSMRSMTPPNTNNSNKAMGSEQQQEDGMGFRNSPTPVMTMTTNKQPATLTQPPPPPTNRPQYTAHEETLIRIGQHALEYALLVADPDEGFLGVVLQD